MPHLLAKVELVSGDGGVDSILQMTFPPPGVILKPLLNKSYVDGCMSISTIES